MTRIAIAVAAGLAVTLAGCGKDEPPKPAPVIPAKKAAAPAVTAMDPTPVPTRRNLPDPPPLPPVAVDNIGVGKKLGADGRIDAAAGPITPKDTVFVAIETSGAGQVLLKARWSQLADGKANLVKEDVQTIVASGPGIHEFHVANPGGGWKPGDYQVEISVNDRPAATRRFGVN